MARPEPVPDLTAVSHAVTEADSLDELARPLLQVLQRVTGLESVYLSRIDWDREREDILVSHNAGTIRIEERASFSWEDTLCRQALADDRRFTDNVAGTWPDNDAARDLGIRTYVMAPVTTPEGEIFGTLCGVSSDAVPVDEAKQELMTMFARLLADRLVRERTMAEHRSRADSAEERLRDRARFLAAAEHQLKTPLTTIVGWSALLRDKWDLLAAEDRVDAVRMVADGAEALRRHVERLLEEARAEIIAREMDPVVADVTELVSGIAKEFAHASRDHEIVAVATEPALARIDQAAMHQILGHLIENAIKYSPGGGTISLRIRRVPAVVLIQVEDHGVGLPEGVDVFAPFTRGDHRTPGIGLGLHIVRSLVDSLGGTIRARRNEDGSGSTFEVLLPAAA